jgi:hypothetical protein
MNPFYTLHPTAVALNVWSHVAVVRRSNIVTLYVNGVGASSFFGNSNLTDQTVRPTIGNYSILYQASGQDYQGYLTNVRVAKSAIYSANFTPSRTPFTRTSQGATNVQLLLNHRTSGTLATDSSANNLSVLNTNVAFSTLSPYTEPFVSTTPPVLVSATVTPSSTAVTEGTTITFSVASTNAANGTYYYTIEETSGGVGTLTTADFSSGALSGSFTITGNSGSFPLTVTRDLTTEGDESFSVYVRSTSITGPVLGVSPIIDITDSSINPVFTVEPGSINEGDTETFTVANVGPDGTYFFTVLNGTSADADFSAVSGSFVVSGSTGGIDNGTGSFDITTVADRATEGSQTFQVQVRSGSVSGTVVVTSAVQTINDTSLTPAFTITPASINEGSLGSFTVNNLGNAGTYFWTVLNGTTVNTDFSAVSGSFVTSTPNGNGTFTVTPVIDYTTEGAQTFQVQIRTGNISGTVILTSASVTVNDTSTTVTASGSPTTIGEPGFTTITASATAFPNGIYYWTILNGTTTNADFTATSGSFPVSNGTSGSFTVTSAIDGAVEAAETFQVQIRIDSPVGTVIATTGTLTIASNVS